MALAENIRAVIDAIETVYSNCGDTKPKQGEIVAASGLSRSTYARVLREHPEAQRALDLATAVLLGRPSPDQDADTDSDDPIRRNPLGAVQELLATITQLTLVIEAQKRRIEALEDQAILKSLDF